MTDLLQGIGCEVEILWTSQDQGSELHEFIVGSKQDFYLTGRRTVESEEGVGQITQRVVDGEVIWKDVANFEWPANNFGPEGVGRSLVRRPDNTVWAFGTHQIGDVYWSWIIAYSSTGAQLWQVDYPDFEWADAAGWGDRVVATGRDAESDSTVIHWLADDGRPENTYVYDGVPHIRLPAVAIGDGGMVWAVNGNYYSACGWRGTWTIDGELVAMACPNPHDDLELFLDVEPLADGSAVAVGRNRVHKQSVPMNSTSYHMNEPLFVRLAEDGSELARWTYGPGVYLSGEVVDVAMLPGGDVVGVSTLNDLQVDEFHVQRGFVHRLTSDLEHVADCELIRPGYAGDYFASARRVEVDSNGDIIVLVSLPGEPRYYALVRITALGE